MTIYLNDNDVENLSGILSGVELRNLDNLYCEHDERIRNIIIRKNDFIYKMLKKLKKVANEQMEK